MNIQKTVRNVLNALLLSIFLSFGANAFAADKWLNPAPYPIGMDTWFGTVYSTTAQHDNRLRVGGWGDMYNTLLRFDLSGFPQVATNAYIWLYAINEGAPTDINWSLIGKQWQSSTVKSSDFPLPSNVLYFAGTTPAPTPGYWYKVNITGIYNAWRSSATYKNYGLYLAPVSNNNNYSSFASSLQGWYGPHLQATYTPQADDGVIKLKWPLGTSYASRVVTQSFGVDWAGMKYCPAGVIKKHNGVDYSAVAGTTVYAPEDGIVKNTDLLPGGWASRIVIEHNHPVSGKYTTVLMHVNPSVAVDNFVPKGMQVATVADLTPFGNDTHFHFGIRIGAYNAIVSGTGALPQATCTDPSGTTYPGFPENFQNPSAVLFQ